MTTDRQKSDTAGNVSIRPARPGDASDIAEMLEQLARNINASKMPRTTAKDITAFGFSDSPHFGIMVAETGASLVGFCLYTPTFSTWRAAPGLYISDLYVSPEVRGQSIGRHLLRAAIQAGKPRQCAFLKLEVGHRNETALTFYSSLGFEYLETERLLVLDGDGYGLLEDGEV